MKNKYIVYGTFEVEVEANSEEEAESQFDIGDADASVQGCYRSDDEAESEGEDERFNQQTGGDFCNM